MKITLKINIIIFINFTSCVSNTFGRITNFTGRLESVAHSARVIPKLGKFTDIDNHRNKFDKVIKPINEFNNETVNSTNELSGIPKLLGIVEVPNAEDISKHKNEYGNVINSTHEISNTANNATYELSDTEKSIELVEVSNEDVNSNNKNDSGNVMINSTHDITNVAVTSTYELNDIAKSLGLVEVPNVEGTNHTSLAESIPGGLGIAGGHATYIGEFPHSVMFINDQGVCGGSIISNDIVLTAAHCLDFNQNKSEMKIYAGSRYLFDQTADVHMVWGFVVHDDYNQPFRFSHDAALLIIHDRFRFKPTVQKALLINHKRWMKDGTVVKVSGWGETVHGEDKLSPKGLQSVELSFLTFSQCKKRAGGPVSPDMFCLWGDGERATCKGDSGSGAMWNGLVVGIVSHGGACGEYPGIYSNVFFLRPWIEKASRAMYYDYCYFHGGDIGDY